MIIKLLAEKVGEVVTVDMRSVPSNMGDFYRVRVMLRASAPLARFVTLSPDGRDAIILQVKYEKMPRFCSYCGFMGHVHLECGTGEYGEKDLQYGEWMLAEEETWRAGTPRFRAQMPTDRDIPRGDFGRGTRGGRVPNRPTRGRAGTYGGGRGPVWREKDNQDEEKTLSRKRNSAEAGVGAEKDEALKDTATSPLKAIAENGDFSVLGKKTTQKQLFQIVDAVPPLPPQYVSPRDQKRAKKVVEKTNKENSPSKNGAGSLEGRRQSQ
jgi:hypothetical protein